MMSKYLRRKVVIDYLEEFFMGLPHDFPVPHKMKAEIWAIIFYEELSEEERLDLYLKIIQ